MSVEGSLGSLLQGVSQQPPRIRVEGQLTDQINYMSDVAQGLTSRPATEQVSILPNAVPGMNLHHLQLKGVHYLVGSNAGEVRVWGMDGAEFPVAYQDANAQGYVGDNVRFSVFDDTVYFTNRDVTVEKDEVVVGRDEYVILATCLGGNFSRTYRVRMVYSSDNTVVIGEYTTPDGTTNGDASKTSSEYIMGQIRATMEAHANWKIGTQIGVKGDVLLVKYPTPLSVTVDDGEGGQSLRAMATVIDDREDLPQYAPHNTVVKVEGDADTADDYYLRFKSSITTVSGAGFGSQGVWEEWYDVDTPNRILGRTMPHVLDFDGTTFTVRRGVWYNRRVGDEETNPYPSFVGEKIRDIGGFESRLIFVAGPNVIMSRTNDALDFWKKSATALIDSDPIDMKSTKEGSVTLDWIVPFDRDLILLSDPGDSQFVVTGGGVTPSNASLVLTTTYEMYGQARPVTTGRTLIFPFRSGKFSGIKEFFTNDQVATNGADTLTEVQSRYITGEVTNMASSKNFNLLVVSSSDPSSQNTLFTYKYLWEGTSRVQSAWSKWVLPNAVRHFFFDNSIMYIVLMDDEGRHFLCKADLNRVINDEGWHVMLDRRVSRTVDLDHVLLDFDDAVVVQSTGCLDPGREAVIDFIVPTEDGQYQYYLNAENAPNGAAVYGGARIRRSIKPTMPIVKDRSGKAVSTARIVVQKFKVHLDDSSDVAAIMHCVYRQPYEFYPRRFPLDDEPLDPNKYLIMDYTFEVPWGEQADLSELELISTDVRPTTILEIEWTGQVTGAKRRV